MSINSNQIVEIDKVNFNADSTISAFEKFVASDNCLLGIALTKDFDRFQKEASIAPVAKFKEDKDAMSFHRAIDSEGAEVKIIEFHQKSQNLDEENLFFHQRWQLGKKLLSELKQSRGKIAVWVDASMGREGLKHLSDVLFMSLPKGLGHFFSKEQEDSVYATVYLDKDIQVDLQALKWDLRNEASYRSWVNENPESLTSIEIGNRIEAFSEEYGLKFESMGLTELREAGLELLLKVGQGSKISPSRLHLCEYRPKGSLEKPILLVGKGITFDTGGINVKSYDNHVSCMKNDMAGSALAFHTFKKLVHANANHPIILAIPTCENAVDSESMRPGSIYRSYSGKTVKVDHTDAEGRLVLADAISYAGKKYSPKLTIVTATLTTAALRQYTGYETPVHFADQKFKEAILKAARENGEFFNFQPFLPAIAAANYDEVADLTNLGRLPKVASMGGGSNVAAHFLREFAEGPLVHLDIFASGWNWSGDYPGSYTGATGAPLHSLSGAIQNLIG